MSSGMARTHDHRIGSHAPYPIAPHSNDNDNDNEMILLRHKHIKIML